jgi:hypothetical protein
MGETKDNPPAEEAKPEATTPTLTTAASSVVASNTTTAPPAITSAKNNTNNAGGGGGGGAKAANDAPLTSSKHPPKQTEEDMKRVAEIAKKKKEEWLKTNKDREFAHRSRTRSVEAYEKLEQVRVILQSARFSQKSIQFFFRLRLSSRFLFFQFEKSVVLFLRAIGKGTRSLR